MANLKLCFLLICWLLVQLSLTQTITFDDSEGYGRTFDGIGGLSGGGATSKLLVNYPNPYRDQILDYLFKPNFGASLHILKVEIGGDIQSTEGTEASHMHYSWDENYERGYEWWLMLEAKKRNPDIKLYGLPWGFPGWVGKGTGDPYHDVHTTAQYVVRWVNGAQTKHGLKIDFVGIWNESRYTVEYIKTLRDTLDRWGYNHTLIVAVDNKWDDIVNDMEKDQKLKDIVHAVGCHYPGTSSTSDAQKLNKILWSSEDYCQINNETGGACWARVVSRNYVHGYMTSTIAWNLIASYYSQLPGGDMGLMTANEPWSGHYEVLPPIWTSAHTTQFTSVYWKYLKHDHGVGFLPKGGSYVALVNPKGDELTIVMETMTFEHSQCVWDSKDPFTVDPQNVTLSLKGSFADIKEMNAWFTELRFDGKKSTLFEKQQPLKFTNGSATIFLDLNQMVTLTTLATGFKGDHPTPPDHQAFPLPYSDDFDNYQLYEEPYQLTQQTGSFEVLYESTNGFFRQMVTEMTIPWCKEADGIGKAYSVFGNYSWSDITVEVSFRIPNVNGSNGVFVGARATKGGCSSDKSEGVYFFALKDQYVLSSDVQRKNVLHSASLTYKTGEWYQIAVEVKGNQASLYFNGSVLYTGSIPNNPSNGWATLGTDSYGLADFDKLSVK